MKKIGLFLVFCISFLACEKDRKGDVLQSAICIARVSDYDLNCASCILEFPGDSAEIRKIAGESPGNLYEALNLNKNDYQTGQLLSVRVRQPEKEEFLPCIALYPSNNYKAIFVSEVENSEELSLNDTVEIFNKTCKFNTENQFYLCLDSILEDNRCPEGMECYIAGPARIRFHYEKINQQPVYFVLSTDPLGTTETNIDRYIISLIDLAPKKIFISRGHPWRPWAKLLIREIR